MQAPTADSAVSVPRAHTPVAGTARRSADVALGATRPRPLAAAASPPPPKPATGTKRARSEDEPRRSLSPSAKGLERASRGSAQGDDPRTALRPLANVAAFVAPSASPQPKAPQAKALATVARGGHDAAAPVATAVRRPVTATLATTAAPHRLLEADGAGATTATATATNAVDGLTPTQVRRIAADEPLTCTQTAEAALGFAPASPPPVFTLPSQSRPRTSAHGSNGGAAASDATDADVWRRATKAFFDRIDTRPLAVCVEQQANVATDADKTPQG